MTARATHRRVGFWAAPLVLVLVVSPVWADEPLKFPKSKPTPTPAQLRGAAETAEKAGDWETAFTVYCHLFVSDRASTDIREKLNVALRRAQQLRRHRDPQFQQFVVNTNVSDSMTLFAEVLTKVPVMYAERERATPQILWENGVEELSRALGNPVFRQAFLDGAAGEKIDTFRNTLRFWARQPVTDAKTARINLKKLVSAAQEAFTVRVPSALVIEIVCGSCSGLDEYTVFLNPTQPATASMAATTDLTAHGIYLGVSENTLVVAAISPRSWAAHHTTLHKGDRIAMLNGRPMTHPTPASIADALAAQTQGFHELELVATEPGSPGIVVRLPVIVPTVYGAAVLNPKEGIGYARIGTFSPTTPRELDEVINSLKARGVRAIVLDLRGNIGGSFLAGIETTKRLLPAGLIVTTQGQLTEVANIPFSSDSGMTAHDIPAVLLIDAETASAAEILAAALKDHNRATLVGMPSFGKGAIQYPLKLESLDEPGAGMKPPADRSGTVRLTIAKLISPRGSTLNGVGVTPDFMEAHPGRQLELAVEKAMDLIPASAMRPMMPVLPISP